MLNSLLIRDSVIELVVRAVNVDILYTLQAVIEWLWWLSTLSRVVKSITI